MRESLRIDSPFMGAGMPKAYSRDLRERVITAVETGASRREAAERFEVSVASAVKWLQRWYQQRSAAPKPRGGSVSPLEEFAVEILDLIAQRPDLTLVETVAELRKRRIKTSRSSLWRFRPDHGNGLRPWIPKQRPEFHLCATESQRLNLNPLTWTSPCEDRSLTFAVNLPISFGGEWSPDLKYEMRFAFKCST